MHIKSPLKLKYLKFRITKTQNYGLHTYLSPNKAFELSLLRIFGRPWALIPVPAESFIEAFIGLFQQLEGQYFKLSLSPSSLPHCHQNVLLKCQLCMRKISRIQYKMFRTVAIFSCKFAETQKAFHMQRGSIFMNSLPSFLNLTRILPYLFLESVKWVEG
jgi:hypothetical protein